MKRKRGTFVGLGLLVLLSIFSLAFTVQAYNANAASDYAFQWSKNYHPDYHNYVDQTSYDEDANFVSQALIAGGLLNSSNPLPAFSDDIGCITNREALAKYLQEYEHAKQVGFKVEGFVPTSLAFGDVVFFRDTAGVINTVGIVIGYNPVRDDFDIAFHVKTSSPGGLAGNINTLTEMSLVFGLPDFYHITKPQETADKQRFYGTGIFDGQGALSAEILTPGNNYLGYIVSNQNRSEQDMVIATDTSQVLYKGCSYLISGYCCDPEKHIPSLGQTFGQPWTSDSPSHWAYWVRQAVLYATANGLEGFLLNAVWYIVDRAGFPDEIITGIGYPADGPMKSEVVYLPLVTSPAVGSRNEAAVSEGPVLMKPPRPLKNFQELLERKRTRTR